MVSTMTLSQRSPKSWRILSRTSGETSWSSKMFPEDRVDLVQDVRWRDLLCHVVHVAAHRAAARPSPIAAARPKDDYPRVHDATVEQVFLGPGGNVFPRIEVPRSSLVLHELREAHGVASNEGGRKNLCALSDDPGRRTGRGSPRPRGRRPRRTGVRRPRRVRGAIRRPTKGTMEGRRGP